MTSPDDHGSTASPPATSSMEFARHIADVVLFEGYLRSPRGGFAAKNRVWQSGALVPAGYTMTAEPSACVTECLLQAGPRAQLRVRLRFLHLRTRTVERAERGRFRPVPELTVDGTTHAGVNDATECEAEAVLCLADLLGAERAPEVVREPPARRPGGGAGAERTIMVGVPGEWSAETIEDASGEVRGRIVTEHLWLRAAVRVRATRLHGPGRLVRLRVTVANTCGWADAAAPREQALRRSLLAAHLLIGVSGGVFLSPTDPPAWAKAAAEECRNQYTWPVLVGPRGSRDVLLSAPIALYDHPEIAPEGPEDWCDYDEAEEPPGPARAHPRRPR